MKRFLQSFWKALRKFLDNRGRLYAVSTLFLAVLIVGILAAWLVSSKRTPELKLYTGPKGGTYFKLGRKIAEQFGDEIRIEVMDTAGSVRNLSEVLKDSEGEVLAIVQNDILPDRAESSGGSPEVRTLLPLHSGMLHFMVRKDSAVRSISDLRGAIVGEGPEESGTPPIVTALLAHYEIEDEVEPVHLQLEEVGDAIREGRVEAVLMTMGLKSEGFENLIDENAIRFVGIGDGVGPGSEIEGFRLNYPFVSSAVIPKSTYSPGVPEKEIPTIAVRAVLVSNNSLSSSIANRITRTLLENRSALRHSYASATEISERFDPGQLQFPLHQGSNRYLKRNEPGFLRQNADVFGFLLSLGIAGAGFLISMRRWMSQRQKDRIDEYYIKLTQMQTKLRNRELDLKQLENLDEEFWRMNRKAVEQLASEKLTANESFRIFQTSLCEGRNEVRRRIEKLNP